MHDVIGLPLVLFVFALPQEGPGNLDPSASIQAAIDEHFTFATPEQRSTHSARLLSAFEQLPPDAGLRRSALSRLRPAMVSAASHLGAIDEFRGLAKDHPEILPLLLPREYYQGAYEAALETIEFEYSRASSFVEPGPEVRRRIEDQLSALRGSTEALLRTRVQGPGGQSLSSHLAERILAEFKAGIGNPFWGLRHPVAETEYLEILTSLREKIVQLPIIKIDEYDPAAPRELSLLNDLKRAELESSPLVTDPLVAEDMITEALSPLYLYSKFNRPQAFEIREKLVRLVAAASTWMAQAKKQHLHTYLRIRSQALREPALPAVGEVDQRPSPEQPSITLAAPPSIPASRPAPIQAVDMDAGRKSTVSILVIVALLFVCLAATLLRRKLG